MTLSAIDMHVHVPRQPGLPEMGVESDLRRYFRVQWVPQNADEMAAKYKEWDILGVIFSVDTETSTGETPDSNDYLAEMDYAGVDWALFHRTPYLGIGNDFIADSARRFPDRIQGLAHVEEWLVQKEPEASIGELERAIKELRLSGLQFLPDQLDLYGQTEGWDSPGFRPFWDSVASLNIPVFLTSGYSSLASPDSPSLEAYLAALGVLRRWMERYPDVTVVLTHGFSWRMFIEGETLSVPDHVFDAAPIDNPNFNLQILLPIFLGGE